MPHTYQYPRAALTVDCVVFGFGAGELKVLLIQRAQEPFKGNGRCRAVLFGLAKRLITPRAGTGRRDRP